MKAYEGSELHIYKYIHDGQPKSKSTYLFLLKQET